MNIFEENVYRNTVGFEMETYQKAFVQAVRKGYHGDNSTDEDSYQWRFAGAFLYSLTVITTIGTRKIRKHDLLHAQSDATMRVVVVPRVATLVIGVLYFSGCGGLCFVVIKIY